MKLVLVSGNPLQETFGGVEEHTDNLKYALSHIKTIQLHHITYSDKNCVFKQNNVIIHCFKRHSVNKIFYPFILPFDILQILNEIKKINPDIVHFQGTHPLYSLTALLCQRKYSTVLTVHGILMKELDFHPNITPIIKNISLYGEKLALSTLKNIIVVAPQIAEIVKNITKANIFVVPNGIDPSSVQKADPLPLDRDNVVLFIGNLIERKGVANLIRAISLVKKEVPDVCLLIAGSGPQESELKTLTSTLSLQDNIRFLGFISNIAKYSYLKSADVVVVPSLWESLPIVVLEGMACGRPIVASNVAGIPYLIHDAENGYLVHPGAKDELAEKICVLLKNETLREQMGKKSLVRVEDLKWDKIAGTTFELYTRILEDGGRR